MKNNKLVKIGLGVGTTLLVAGAVLYKATQGNEIEYAEVNNTPDNVIDLKPNIDYVDVDVVEQ